MYDIKMGVSAVELTSHQSVDDWLSGVENNLSLVK